MTIGQRIKARRKELHISADELGKKLGKDRSTIFRYEKGDIENLPLDILKPIADALGVTPAYLMGWEKEIKVDTYIIQHDDIAIAVELFDSLNDEGMKRAIDYMETLRKVYPKEEPLLNAAHERTDIEVTDEMKKHDDDIMDDDNF